MLLCCMITMDDWDINSKLVHSLQWVYLLTYLLTHSMNLSPSWEANLFSASQEIPRILWNPKVHCRIHKSSQSRPEASVHVSWQLLRRGVVNPSPKPKLKGHPLSAVRDCVFNIFAPTLHIWDRSSIRNLRKCHTVVAVTHLSRLQLIYFLEYNVFSDTISIWKWMWRRTYILLPRFAFRGINSGTDGFFLRVLEANGQY
jgi:hypothetical protein